MTPKNNNLPVHALREGAIRVLPLDHSNPYDYKREHRHTYFELMFIAGAGGNQLIDFEDYILRANSCYIIFPQQVHLMNRGEASGWVVQFEEAQLVAGELRAALQQHFWLERPAIIFEERADLAAEFLPLLPALGKHCEGTGARLAAVYLLQALVAMALHNRQQTELPNTDADKALWLDFCRALEANYAQNWGVQQYIQQLGTTDKKLAAAVRKHAGLRPLQVIHNRIVLEIKRLLLFERNSHKEIAFSLGFDSAASFSAFVKTKTGYTPSELCEYLAEIHK